MCLETGTGRGKGKEKTVDMGDKFAGLKHGSFGKGEGRMGEKSRELNPVRLRSQSSIEEIIDDGDVLPVVEVGTWTKVEQVSSYNKPTLPDSLNLASHPSLLSCYKRKFSQISSSSGQLASQQNIQPLVYSSERQGSFKHLLSSRKRLDPVKRRHTLEWNSVLSSPFKVEPNVRNLSTQAGGEFTVELKSEPNLLPSRIDSSKHKFDQTNAPQPLLAPNSLVRLDFARGAFRAPVRSKFS